LLVPALERFDKEDIRLAATLSGKHWLKADDRKGGGRRRRAS